MNAGAKTAIIITNDKRIILILTFLGCFDLLKRHWPEMLDDRPISGIIQNDKVFISNERGVIILPKDNSYKRFISNSWYNDINTDNL